jgi:PRC-barrel domain
MHSSSILRVVSLTAALAIPFCASNATAASSQATGPATAARGTAIQVPIQDVSNPKGRLAGASVQDKNGVSIGKVRDVIVDSSGAPVALRIDVGGFLGMGTKLVEIDASKLRYEQDRNVLTTTLRKPEIEALPAIKT